MCGFAGVVHWDGEPVGAGDALTMVRQAKHRGPDELIASQCTPAVALGHARLKVIDLSDAARQPMASDDGKVWLVFNGEVYNFQELRRHLEGKGYRFRSRSDTEVVLRAYEALGTDAVAWLDGMFALAIWDERNQTLLLARDRTGKKPLFYWTDGRCAAFGSEIKSLLAHPHVPREADESVLPFLLAFGYPPTGQTCYRGIRQVPPATWIQLRAGDRQPEPRGYWDLRFSGDRARVSDADAAYQVRELLKKAVDRRMVADVPLGAFLSGGIDSTIVVGLMAELQPGNTIKTFSIGFEGDRRFDETHYAKLVAARYRTDHTPFVVTPQSFDLLDRLVQLHDQPFGDSSAVPTYILSELTRRHVTVALTGDGGDELFAGYVRFLAATWAELTPGWLLAGADRALAPLPAGRARSWLGAAKRFTSVASRPMPERYLQWMAYCRDPRDWLLPGVAKEASAIRPLHPSVQSLWQASQGQSTLAQALYINFKDYLPNDLLVKTDRCTMAHGLEARAPFLDTALMEYAAALPDDMKMDGYTTKRILRKACADLLPPEIQRRKKMGFGVPLATWFRGAWRQPVQDLLGSPQSRSSRYLEAGRVRELVRAHLSGEVDAGHQLWLFLTLETWLRQMEQPRPQPSETAHVVQAA